MCRDHSNSCAVIQVSILLVGVLASAEQKDWKGKGEDRWKGKVQTGTVAREHPKSAGYVEVKWDDGGGMGIWFDAANLVLLA